MIRLNQRQCKKLILINPPESGFNHFADVIYDNLNDVMADIETLFIYNINNTSEADAFAIWQKASQVNNCECNVLMTSDYPNLTGLLALGITASKAEAEFVLSYGAYPELGKKAKFKIAVMPFFEEKAPVDLLLPQPTYLEIEGTALANAGIVTRYHNPAQSDIFNQILKMSYELNWIAPNLAEPGYWNNKAEQFLKSSEMLIKPDVLKDKELGIDFVLTAHLEQLHELKNQKQTGFPKEV